MLVVYGITTCVRRITNYVIRDLSAESTGKVRSPSCRCA